VRDGKLFKPIEDAERLAGSIVKKMGRFGFGLFLRGSTELVQVKGFFG